MKVIGIGTDPTLTERLRVSCEFYGLDLIILGLGKIWGGFGSKYRWVRDYLESAPSSRTTLDEIIIVMDGYDTLCQSSPSIIAEKCERLCAGGKILVSTEIFSWPPEVSHTAKIFEKIAEHRCNNNNAIPCNVYPCAGQWAGNRQSVQRFVNRILHLSNKNTDDFDDQGVLAQDIIDSPHLYVMDYDCDVFQANIYYLATNGDKVFNRALSIAKNDGHFVVRHAAKSTLPCFLHCNGMGSSALDIMERDHVAPLRKLWSLPDVDLPPMPAVRAITLPQRESNVKLFAQTERWDVKIFPATTTTTLPTPKGLTQGEHLCYLSHVKLIENFLKEGNETDLFILEDDIGVASAVIGRTSRELISDQWCRFREKSDYDILLIGRCWDICETAKSSTIPNSPDMLVPEEVGCTHAWIIRWKSLSKVLSWITSETFLKETIDDRLSRGKKAGILMFVASNPPLINQMGLPSTIGTRAGQGIQSITCRHPRFIIQDYVDIRIGDPVMPITTIVDLRPYKSSTESAFGWKIVLIATCLILLLLVFTAAWAHKQ